MSVLVRWQDRLVYSFLNVDRIFDFLFSIGVRPFVELSFMPTALASGTVTIFHYRANVTPPRECQAWGDLVRRLLTHWVERYGLDEVRQWYFEVWNEPNLSAFWTGSQRQYFELYRHSALAIKAVDASLRVGGPATAKNEWVSAFLDFCEGERLPADFVSTHHYPNDPLWSEAQDTEAELAGSRRSLLRDWARDVRDQARGRPLLYTEWNISSNPRYPRHDEPYAAAFAVKTILEMNGLVEAYSFWTFSDVFEESYFPSVPYHGGFGLLNLYGIPKPTYRAFELLHRLGAELLPVTGRHETVDAWVVRGEGRLTVLLTNHALPRHPLAGQRVHIELTDALPPHAVQIERIDEDHANAKKTWLLMGQPEYLREDQVQKLEAASRLVAEPQAYLYEQGKLSFEVKLPPHGVAAVTVKTR
jgi:xylan 1,4-beta-xylosidase